MICSRLLPALAFLASLSQLPAMTVNLATPYSTKPVPPRSADVVFVTPGRDDFQFLASDTPRLVCVPYLRALDLQWELSHNLVKATLRTGSTAVRYDNSLSIDLPLHELAPGFYDVRVKISLTATETLSAQTTVGWRVDEIALHAERPVDFDAFWTDSLAGLDSVNPSTQYTLERTLRGPEIDAYNLVSASLPGNYHPAGVRSEVVEIYRVSFASAKGRTIHGWFTKPAGPGPFPALLVLPGAGNAARPAPVEHARHGYAALDIQVHGNPVDGTSYDRLPIEKPERPEDFIHHGVYLHALQAGRVLRNLPGVDANRLAVVGGSQGGRLSIVVAALDHGFKAAVASITHYAYLPWVDWGRQLNKVKKAGSDTGFAPSDSAVSMPPDRYFDVVNFAFLVRCPVLMNKGLIDAISPPTGIQAVYLNLAGPKEIIALPNIGHDWSPSFDRHAWDWLGRILQP